MQWAYIRIQVFTPEQVKILKTSRPIMKLVLSTTLLIVQIFISLLSAAPRILHVEEAEPFNPLEQAVVVPLLNYTTAFLPFGIEPELQSTSTWQTIHPTQPWDKITMNATEFTRQWLLQNHPGEWHLRIVEQNQAHPKLHTVLFDGEIQLPPEIVAEIEDRLAFRVYHLVPPQMIFQLACNVFKQNRLKETFEAGEKIFSLLHTGASWFYKAINDVENSMATDGDLGKLRESLLTSQGPKPDWSIMSREEAKTLETLLSETAKNFTTLAISTADQLSEYPDWPQGISSQCQTLAKQIGWDALAKYGTVLSQLRGALNNARTPFKPYDARYFWTGKVGIKRLRAPKPTGGDVFPTA